MCVRQIQIFILIILEWFPENLTTAHAVMQYNLAVAMAFTGEFEKSSELLKKIWHSKTSTRKVPIHVVMLFLYSELQSGALIISDILLRLVADK